MLTRAANSNNESNNMPLAKRARRTNTSNAEYASFLNTHGYVCVPLLSSSDLDLAIASVTNEVANFPEFQHAPTDPPQYVLGGFAALANAASFHNPTVRHLRTLAHSKMLPIFKELVRTGDKGYTHNMNLEQLIDRLLIRSPGQTPSGESWHRDVALGTLLNDVVFGGWINLDTSAQVFTGVPGTHDNALNKSAVGFATVKKQANINKYKQTASKIVIPPGHIFVFNELIVHAVMCKPSKTVIRRLFTGWRLTTSARPLFATTIADLQSQAVMQIKSGQMPAIYPKLYWTNWRDKLVQWSKCVHPSCRELRTVGSGLKQGEILDVAKQIMPDLRTLNKMYAPYTQREINMHVPHRLVSPQAQAPRTSS